MECLTRLTLHAFFILLAVILVPINHFTRRWNWNCRQRTGTSRQRLFSFSRPHPVSFDFAARVPDIEIRIPPYSSWCSEAISHNTTGACVRLQVVSGSWFLLSQPGGAVSCSKDYVAQQRPRSFMTWQKIGQNEQAACLRLTADTGFYHTICSAVQDAKIYFSLSATPFWLRAIFYGTYAVPFGFRIRERMIQDALWFQLRVIYAANDSWTHEGELRLDLLWGWPPEWAERWQFESQFVISRIVVKAASWIGRVTLGMKDTYLEYERIPIDGEVVRMPEL